MTLNPDGWRRVESLFHAAADLSDEARDAMLAQELEQSHEVVDAVRRMLAADGGPHALLDADAFVILSRQPKDLQLPDRDLGRDDEDPSLRSG